MWKEGHDCFPVWFAQLIDLARVDSKESDGESSDEDDDVQVVNSREYGSVGACRDGADGGDGRLVCRLVKG